MAGSEASTCSDCRDGCTSSGRSSRPTSHKTYAVPGSRSRSIPKHGSARITAIPEDVRAAFAKRTVIGTAAAYAQAEKLGLDWNELDEPARVAMLKQGVQGDPRAAKRDDLGDRVSWQAEAAALGYKHSSVLDTEPARPPLTRTQRLDNAYAVTLDLLEPQLDNNAVLQ